MNFGYYGEYAVWRDRPMEDIRGRQLAAGKPLGPSLPLHRLH
ncbi:MAG: hypothetical protein ACLU9S_10820 [Oscillospiraceae bacterium]